MFCIISVPTPINAKLDPKYAGALAFVIRMNNRVPIPFINKTIPGFTLNNIGTKTDAPNIANVCCKLSGNNSAAGTLSLTPIIPLTTIILLYFKKKEITKLLLLNG